MDLKSILDTTGDSTFYDEVIRDYYDNRILLLNDDISDNLIENCIIYILNCIPCLKKITVNYMFFLL